MIGPAADAEPTPAGPVNILMVGSDSREGLGGAEAFQGRGAEFVTGQRSDVVMLVHLFGSGRRTQFVSILRDAYVDIPAFRELRTGKTAPARKDRLNSAVSTGGPALLCSSRLCSSWRGAGAALCAGRLPRLQGARPPG